MIPAELPPMIAAQFQRDPELCAWFLKCGNDATTTRPHPILGSVPICQRCDDKVTALEA